MAEMFSRELKAVAISLQRLSSTGSLLYVPSPFGPGLQLLALLNCKNFAHSCMCCSSLGNQPHPGLASRSGLCPVKQEPAPKILITQSPLRQAPPRLLSSPPSPGGTPLPAPWQQASIQEQLLWEKTSVLVENRINALPGTKGNTKLAERGKLRRPRNNTGESRLAC
jgi:hypothetical protein